MLLWRFAGENSSSCDYIMFLLSEPAGLFRLVGGICSTSSVPGEIRSGGTLAINGISLSGLYHSNPFYVYFFICSGGDFSCENSSSCDHIVFAI
jgi:hypothetical protein